MKSIQSKNSKPNNSIHSTFFQKKNHLPFLKNENSFFYRNSIQDLTLNKKNDNDEGEADTITGKAVQQLTKPGLLTKEWHSTPPAKTITPVVQTKCKECENEQLQKKKQDEIVQNPQLQKKPIFESNAEPNDEENTIQRKCASGNNRELTIQKKDAGFLSNLLSGPASTPGFGNETSAGFIVEDNVAPAAGQMQKTIFLNRLKEEVCITVNQALAGTAFSSDNCPYLQAAFARHQYSSPAQLEALINRYCPSAAFAQSAEDIIRYMKIKIYASAKQWAENGGGIPDATQVFGSISSGVGSVISTVSSTVSGIASSIGSLFFKANESGANAIQSPQSVMQSLGRGQSIDSNSKGKMESAFGTSFSNVEVHTDSNAANLSSNMNARAFTVGNHIAFASGEHKPGTLIGDALMAHELAHTVQQRDLKQNGLNKKDGRENSLLETDADNSAVGAVLSWNGMKGSIRDIGKKVNPELRSGLRLQRCAHAAAPTKTSGKSPSFNLSGDWTKDVETAKKTSNEMMMVALAQQAVGAKITIQPVGKKDINEIIPEDFAEAPIVNFDVNLNNSGRKRKNKFIGSNAGYAFLANGKKYAVIGPNSLDENSPLITKMTAEHELYHTVHHLDKGNGSLSDDQELETWTESYINYFHQFLSITKGRPVFNPLLDYYSTATDDAKKKSVAKIKAYYEAPPDKDPEKVKKAISLWVYKWKSRESKNRKGEPLSKELIVDLEKFVKPYQ